MIKETEFMNVQTPGVFATRGLAELTSVALRAEKMSLPELELEKLHKINQVLNHPELIELIRAKKITVGMIKPRVDQGSDKLTVKDETSAQLLMEEIGSEHIVFSLSMKLLPKDIEKFYAGNNYINDIKNHFDRGAATFLLLYYEEGSAVDSWREHMGKTDPKKADPSTIRGRYADNVKNNLVHGSDSVEAVEREIGILRDITMEMEEKSIKVRDSFPSESEFALNPGERLLAIEKTCAPRRKLPNFVGVIYRDELIERRSSEKQLSKAS